MILVLDRSSTQSTVQFVEEPHESSACFCPALDLEQVADLALERLQGIGTTGLLHPFQEDLLEPLLVELQVGEKMIGIEFRRRKSHGGRLLDSLWSRHLLQVGPAGDPVEPATDDPPDKPLGRPTVEVPPVGNPDEPGESS